jgi:hypothetical protein
MSSTSVLLGRSAAPHTLTHEGRTYTFRPLGQREKSEFERWLITRTREVLTTLYSGEDLRQEMDALKREAIAGAYDFHGEIAQQVLTTTKDGALKLASIIMGCDPDEVLPLWMARGDEIRALLDLVVAESTGVAGGSEKNVPPPSQPS